MVFPWPFLGPQTFFQPLTGPPIGNHEISFTDMIYLNDQQTRLETSRGACLLPYVESKGIGHGFENASILPLDLDPEEFATYVHPLQLNFNYVLYI